jgi:hypothetical protein
VLARAIKFSQETGNSSNLHVAVSRGHRAQTLMDWSPPPPAITSVCPRPVAITLRPPGNCRRSIESDPAGQNANEQTPLREEEQGHPQLGGRQPRVFFPMGSSKTDGGSTTQRSTFDVKFDINMPYSLIAVERKIRKGRRGMSVKIQSSSGYNTIYQQLL